MNERLLAVLKDAVECRCRPNIDDIDAQNILFMLDGLRKQRDDLLAAIEKYLPESDHYSDDGVQFYSELCDAIDSVKGQP